MNKVIKQGQISNWWWAFQGKLPWTNVLKNINRGDVIHYLLFKVSWRAPKLLDRLKCESEVKTTKE
jgi:hypothetical protein